MFAFYGYFMGSWDEVIVAMLWLMLLDPSWCPDPPCLIYGHRSRPRLDGLQSLQLHHLMNLTVVDWTSGEIQLCLYSVNLSVWLEPLTAASIVVLQSLQTIGRKLLISIMIAVMNAWLISSLANVNPVWMQILSRPKKTTHSFSLPWEIKKETLLSHNDTLSQTNKARCENEDDLIEK